MSRRGHPQYCQPRPVLAEALLGGHGTERAGCDSSTAASSPGHPRQAGIGTPGKG